MKDPTSCDVGILANVVQRGRNWKWLALLGLALAIIQLTGCSSLPLYEQSYNPVTGYPAVGNQFGTN